MSRDFMDSYFNSKRYKQSMLKIKNAFNYKNKSFSKNWHTAFLIDSVLYFF